MLKVVRLMQSVGEGCGVIDRRLLSRCRLQQGLLVSALITRTEAPAEGYLARPILILES